MGIDLRWEDERGRELDSLLDPHNHLLRFLASLDLGRTSCLRFIDPYGDTVFNQLQIPTLLEELQSFAQPAGGTESALHVQQVIALTKKRDGEVHTYIKFSGD